MKKLNHNRKIISLVVLVFLTSCLNLVNGQTFANLLLNDKKMYNISFCNNFISKLDSLEYFMFNEYNIDTNIYIYKIENLYSNDTIKCICDCKGGNLHFWSNKQHNINRLLSFFSNYQVFTLTTIFNGKIEDVILLQLDTNNWFEYTDFNCTALYSDRDFFLIDIKDFSSECITCINYLERNHDKPLMIPLPKGNLFLKNIYNLIEQLSSKNSN